MPGTLLFYIGINEPVSEVMSYAEYPAHFSAWSRMITTNRIIPAIFQTSHVHKSAQHSLVRHSGMSPPYPDGLPLSEKTKLALVLFHPVESADRSLVPL